MKLKAFCFCSDELKNNLELSLMAMRNYSSIIESIPEKVIKTNSELKEIYAYENGRISIFMRNVSCIA